MHSYDVLPEGLAVIISLIPRVLATCTVGLIVNAYLPQVFHDDLLACEERVADGAVLAVAETMLVLEFLVAILTVPKDEMRLHDDLLAEFTINLIEVLEEIKRFIVD